MPCDLHRRSFLFRRSDGEVDIDHRPPLGLDPLDVGRQAPDGLGSEDKVHPRHASQDFRPFLLSHTAPDADDERRFLVFQPTQAPQEAEGFLLGLGPDGARVYQHQIRLFQNGRRHIPPTGQFPNHPLRIVDVHLAPDGAQVYIFDCIHSTVDLQRRVSPAR